MNNYYKENIEFLKSLGFVNANFGGYGATGYVMGELEVWWGEWGEATIYRKINDSINKIELGFIGGVQFKNEITLAIETYKNTL